MAISTRTTRLEELGRELGEAIVNHPKYEARKEAKVAIGTDDDVQELITEFSQLRKEFNVPQQTGEAAQEGLQRARAIQEEFHSGPVMREYLLAQVELVGELERISGAISRPLTADFGGEVGGCYND